MTTTIPALALQAGDVMARDGEALPVRRVRISRHAVTVLIGERTVRLPVRALVTVECRPFGR